jgi:hypothetical protein
LHLHCSTSFQQLIADVSARISSQNNINSL